jgi:hypothetical protein
MRRRARSDEFSSQEGLARDYDDALAASCTQDLAFGTPFLEEMDLSTRFGTAFSARLYLQSCVEGYIINLYIFSESRMTKT